jgi:hypothetical protein
MDAEGNLSQDEFAGAAGGLAAVAITRFEMGDDNETARNHVLSAWESLGSPPGMFAAAATSISGMPQPPMESASKSERMDGIRDALGAMSPSAHLEAMLRARELLETLASEEA